MYEDLITRSSIILLYNYLERCISANRVNISQNRELNRIKLFGY